MIKTQDDYIFDGLTGKDVILNFVNCTGKPLAGFSTQLVKKYPGWYEDFTGYCSWFSPSTWCKDDHTDEIFGTFHRYEVNDNLIICSIFCNVKKSANNGKNFFIDIDALDKACRTIANQTKYVNAKLRDKWTLNMQITSSLSNSLQYDDIMEVFETYFKNGNDMLVLHQY